MDNGLINKNPRIGVVDSLRGFALVAIFLIHTSNHFLYNSFPADSSVCDDLLRSILYFLFENKAYTIFAALFGFTFALQMDNHKMKCGGDFGWLMLWRMILLVVIGLFNAALFVGGDPLVFYALAMMLIIPLRNISSKLLTVLVVIILIQPFELLNTIFGWFGMTSYGAYYTELNSVMVQGDVFSTFWAGMTTGVKGALCWAVETGRFTQTLGLFIVGIIAYRIRLLGENNRWSKCCVLYAVLTAVLYCLANYVFDFFRVYYNLCFALTIIVFIMQVAKKYPRNLVLGWLAIYGRMSLTNFVTQSLFGALLYYPWALDLGAKLGVCDSILITLTVIALQILFSKFWLSRFRRGPIEGIWHKAVYLFK